MSERGLWLQLLVVGLAVLSLSVAVAGTALGNEDVQNNGHTAGATGGVTAQDATTGATAGVGGEMRRPASTGVHPP